jgi:hypothetical protein
MAKVGSFLAWRRREKSPSDEGTAFVGGEFFWGQHGGAILLTAVKKL